MSESSASPLPLRITPVPQSLFAETYGGSLISCQVTLVLYGLASLQTYMYFLRYSNDSIAMRSLVTTVWALATLHVAFLCHVVYHFLVLSYTNPLLLIDGEWSVYSATCIGVVSRCLIQIFFARMIYHLTQNKWRYGLTVAFTILILGQVAFGIFLCVRIFQLWQLPKLKDAVYPAVVPLLVIRVVSDALTAVTLCIVLYGARTDFGRSVRLIKTLIVYAMNRFMLTTVVVIAQTIILIAKPDAIWPMVIDFVSVQLYVNSLLATLNARNHLRTIGAGDGTSMDYMSTSRIGDNAIRFKSHGTVPTLTEGAGIDIENQRSIGVDLRYGAGMEVGTETLMVTDFKKSDY